MPNSTSAAPQLISLCGSYINFGYLIGVFPFKFNHKDMKISRVQNQYDYYRCQIMIVFTATSLIILITSLGFGYESDLRFGRHASKVLPMFKFSLLTISGIFVVGQLNLYTNLNEITKAMNSTIILFLEAPGTIHNYNAGPGPAKYFDLMRSKSLMVLTYILISSVISAGFLLSSKCHLIFECNVVFYHLMCNSNESGIILNTVRFTYSCVCYGLLMATIQLTQALYVGLVLTTLRIIKIYFTSLRLEIQAQTLTWSKFKQIYKILQIYLRITNISLGSLFLPAQIFAVTSCIIFCINTIIKGHHIQLDSSHNLMHGSVIISYVWALGSLFRRYCWSSELGLGTLQMIRKQVHLSSRQKKEIHALHGMYFWFGCFGIADKDLYHLVINSVIDAVVSILLV